MNSIVAEKKFIQERIGIPYTNLSQSYLQAETQLTNLSSYSFQLQRGQVASPLVTDQLLELNDQFVITHFRVGLKYITATTAGVPTATEHLTAQIYTYADPVTFSSTSANAASVFNSFLSFTIDRREFLPQFPCAAFYRVPTTQTGAFLDTAGTTGTPAATFVGNTGVNGYDNGLYGFYPSEPTLIDGRQTLDLALNLGAAVSIATSGANPYVSAVFQVRGYLVVNAKS
jgi:hypothetical protein